MTEHVCPSCNEKGFTWSLDEEASANIIWYCTVCKFRAEEKEDLESMCLQCNIKNNMYLESGGSYFRYCTECKTKTEADP